MTPALVNKPNFNGIMEYSNNLLLVRATDIDNINPHTKY